MPLQGLGSSVDWSKKTPQASYAAVDADGTHTDIADSGYLVGWSLVGDGQLRLIIDGETLFSAPVSAAGTGPTNFRFEDGFTVEAAPQGGWSGPVYYVLDP